MKTVRTFTAAPNLFARPHRELSEQKSNRARVIRHIPPVQDLLEEDQEQLLWSD